MLDRIRPPPEQLTDADIASEWRLLKAEVIKLLKTVDPDTKQTRRTLLARRWLSEAIMGPIAWSKMLVELFEPAEPAPTVQVRNTVLITSDMSEAEAAHRYYAFINNQEPDPVTIRQLASPIDAPKDPKTKSSEGANKPSPSIMIDNDSGQKH
jgi:hypothetical protein